MADDDYLDSTGRTADTNEWSTLSGTGGMESSPVRGGSVENLPTEDPRYNLPLVRVPEARRKTFSVVADCVLYWFGDCKKKHAKPGLGSAWGDRTGFLTDKAFFLVKPDFPGGEISRSLPLMLIRKVFTNLWATGDVTESGQKRAHFIAFQMESPEVDLVVEGLCLDELLAAINTIRLSKNSELEIVRVTTLEGQTIELEHAGTQGMPPHLTPTKLSTLKKAIASLNGSPVREGVEIEEGREDSTAPLPKRDTRYSRDLVLEGEVPNMFRHAHLLRGAAMYWASRMTKHSLSGVFSSKEYPGEERICVLCDQRLYMMKTVSLEVSRCICVGDLDKVFTNIGNAEEGENAFIILKSAPPEFDLYLSHRDREVIADLVQALQAMYLYKCRQGLGIFPAESPADEAIALDLKRPENFILHTPPPRSRQEVGGILHQLESVGTLN